MLILLQQKQQLTHTLPPPGESPKWVDQLNDDVPFVRLEKGAAKVKETCARAQKLLKLIVNNQLSPGMLVEAVQEMLALDETSVGWRKSSEWNYKSLRLSDLPQLRGRLQPPTKTIELHPDVWHAYEWNYHRAARITFHQQILKCFQEAMQSPKLDWHAEFTIVGMAKQCHETVERLADEILATVPQSLGDIDHLGHLHDPERGPPKCKAIGGYLLLWPIRILKSPSSATTELQKWKASMVAEKIRDYTGMRSQLGDLSII